MAEPIDPMELTKDHIGRFLRIETKIKSKPVIGKIVNVVNRSASGLVRVELEQAFGTRAFPLTKDNETSLED